MYLEACKLGFKKHSFVPSFLPSFLLPSFSFFPWSLSSLLLLFFWCLHPLGTPLLAPDSWRLVEGGRCNAAEGTVTGRGNWFRLFTVDFPLNQSTNQVKWFYLCLLICLWFVFDWIPHLRRTTEVAEGGSRGSTVADVWWRGRDVSKEWIHMTIQHISTFFLLMLVLFNILFLLDLLNVHR